MPHLLDINVLIALIDGYHVHHRQAMRWFMTKARGDWLTCPTTQNGAIRIMSGTRYPPGSFTPGSVAERLQSFIGETDHRFVADDVSLLNDSLINQFELKSSGQVTDTYLLALAVANQAQLATMDRRLLPDAVNGGAEHLLKIPESWKQP